MTKLAPEMMTYTIDDAEATEPIIKERLSIGVEMTRSASPQSRRTVLGTLSGKTELWQRQHYKPVLVVLRLPDRAEKCRVMAYIN